MRVRCVIMVGYLAALSSCARSIATPQAQSSDTIVFTDVTTIDPGAPAPLRERQTVVVRGGRIIAVGPVDSVRVDAGARVVSGRGKFLIPGLWDAHVHFMNAGRAALPMYLANGVTSVREMGGYIDSTRAWQQLMRDNQLDGPRIMTPGGMLESPRYLQGVEERSARAGGLLAPRILPYRVGIASAAEARSVMDSLVRLRVNFIKYRTVGTREALFDILREARRVGLHVAGHRPGVVPVSVAVDSGQRDFEHALGVTDTTMRNQLAAQFRSRGVWYTPTLSVARAVTVPGDSAFQRVFRVSANQMSVDRAAASPYLLSWWAMQIAERQADTSTANRRAVERDYLETQRDVRAFARAGVQILAGTDAGSVLVYPGSSLHDELELLVGAGLTPQQALVSATIAPATFFGLQQSVGAIRSGFEADLVLLNANPLESIANTRKIESVMRGGRYYSRAQLAQLMGASQ